MDGMSGTEAAPVVPEDRWTNRMRDAVLLLRIPFSVYLAPIFLFAAGMLPQADPLRLLWGFLVVHLLLYPATNGYNSWHDRDEGAIGGLEHPPEVNRWLLYLTWGCEAGALLGAWAIAPRFALFVGGYLLFSRAYSSPAIRIKRRPWIGYATVLFFQGFYTYAMVWVGLAAAPAEGLRFWLPAIASSLFLAGYYPLTQVYQHEEDARRGDRTISLVLGIRGTFNTAAAAFALAGAAMAALWFLLGEPWRFGLFLVLLAPAGAYFLWWRMLVRRHPSHADYASAMRMTRLSAWGMNLFMGSLLLNS